MGDWVLFASVFGASAVLAKHGTDLWCRIARGLGLVDRPNAPRKLHAEPVPVGGGVVVLLVTVLVFAGCRLLSVFSFPLSQLRLIPPFLLASVVLVCVGLVDDKQELGGKVKIFSQTVVASILLVFADSYSTVSFLGGEYNLGHLFYPLGILWLVGLINAVNFLDGADGVASTAGIVMSLAAAVMAALAGQSAVAVIAVIFAGALLGFLFCNFPPAKVYLGDTGAMLIGLVVGTLLLRASTENDHVIRIVPPLAVAVIPLFDTALSFFRRVSSGRGLFAPDRCHIQHRLRLRFGEGRRMLAALAALCALGGGAGVVGLYANDWPALAAFLLLPCGLVASRLFGWQELGVLVRYAVDRYRKWCSRLDYEKHGETFCYQGEVPWGELWCTILNFLREQNCIQARLDINIPSSHENYLARWSRLGVGRDDAVFLDVCVPLAKGGRKLGALAASFDPNVAPEVGMDLTLQLSRVCQNYIARHIHLPETRQMEETLVIRQLDIKTIERLERLQRAG